MLQKIALLVPIGIHGIGNICICNNSYSKKYAITSVHSIFREFFIPPSFICRVRHTHSQHHTVPIQIVMQVLIKHITDARLAVIIEIAAIFGKNLTIKVDSYFLAIF